MLIAAMKYLREINWPDSKVNSIYSGASGGDVFRLIILVLILTGSITSEASTLTFTTPHDEPISTVNSDGFVDRIVSEAVSRTGNRLRIVHLPAERALINANRGIDDGALHRVAGLNKKYPNLIQAKESTSVMEFVAFTNLPGIRIRNWESLKNYTVAIITGWKILEENIPRETELTKVKNPQQLFSLLQNHRIDLVLYGKWQGLVYLKKNNISGVRLLEPALAKQDMYVYFNKKHKNLVPSFDKALRSMKKDGSWDKIYMQTLQPLVR